MRRTAIVFLLAACLSGCGEEATPLTRALAAFRAGDHDALLKAKAEADAAFKTAIQPGDDLCLTTMMDLEKYGDVDFIGKLDHAGLLHMDDDAKLAYALNVAGYHWTVPPATALSRSPLSMTYREGGLSCAGEEDKTEKARIAAAPQEEVEDEARKLYFRNWIADMKGKNGDSYGAHMQAAVATLKNAGYSATWPASEDLDY